MVKKMIIMGVILTMMFSFVACGNASKEVTAFSVEDMIELQTWIFTSGIPNNLIIFKDSDENIVFECVVDKGNFYLKGKEITAKPGDTLSWQPDSSEDLPEQAFIDIILKNGDEIIGYGIIRVTGNNSSNFSAEFLIFSLFPKTNGEYQKITEDTVKSLIELTKK